MKKKDLETTVKEKVSPLIEESLEETLGVSIPKLESDITDQLSKPILDIYIPSTLKFKDAKKAFKKEFLKRELQLHLGNISHLAKTLDIDRRSIHRTIKDLDINIDSVRLHTQSREQYYQGIVSDTIRVSLEPYKHIIREDKMEKVYLGLPKLSRNIAKSLPPPDFTWKEAEEEFEKEFLARVLKQAGSVSKAAAKIDIRVETLHRKLNKLGLR